MSTTPSNADLQAAIDHAIKTVYAANEPDVAPPANAAVYVDGQKAGEYSG